MLSETSSFALAYCEPRARDSQSTAAATVAAQSCELSSTGLQTA